MLQACLTKDPTARPSAEELLHHDWVVRQRQADAAGIPEVGPCALAFQASGKHDYAYFSLRHQSEWQSLSSTPALDLAIDQTLVRKWLSCTLDYGKECD